MPKCSVDRAYFFSFHSCRFSSVAALGPAGCLYRAMCVGLHVHMLADFCSLYVVHYASLWKCYKSQCLIVSVSACLFFVY